MEQEIELVELTGTVDSVIYKNEENGYTVLRLSDENGQLQTVVGYFPYVCPGESMIVSGSWKTHSVHGRQFSAEFAQRLMPTGKKAIYEYLAGGTIKGIGPAIAAMIVDRFGDSSLDILENSPEELCKIKGISLQKAKQMSKSFCQQAGVRRLMEFICSFGLRPVLAMRMYKYYGSGAIEVLRANPYIVAAAHIGGSFAEADRLALEMGFDSYSPSRIDAAVLFELKYNTGNGHCFIPKEKLASATAQLIGVDYETSLESIERLVETGQLAFEEIGGCGACYLPELYEAERDAAERISYMCMNKMHENVDVNRLIEELEQRQHISYAAKQKETLRLALENQIIVITGGPGTGKTTAIRAILEMFDRLKIKTLLAAPTGRAAKRMSELSGRDASTVHRLLEAKFDEDGEKLVFTKNEDDQLDCGAIVLDECSMVDISLMDALLKAMPADARLVMVGDADQLPSVGPGKVFSAVIRSGVVPTVRLTEIFRQNEGSKIVRNAHMINRGEHPDLSENTGDFFRLRRLESESAVDTILELCTKRLPLKMHIPSEDIQVLSPGRKGELGTVSLNKRLQAVLNPPSEKKKEKVFGDYVFREGDRIMQIRNNYDVMWESADGRESGSGIFNGDIGVIRDIDKDTETMKLDFDGKIAVYSFELLTELEHAWAMTVHKSQGSEYRAVVLALNPGSQLLMTRGVLYTAVTRAKELLILVGDDRTAYQMIDNYRVSNRYSALRLRIKKLCGAE